MTARESAGGLMVSNVLNVRAELNSIMGEPVSPSRTKRVKWSWIIFGVAGAAIPAFALISLEPPVSTRSYELEARDPLPASLYFDRSHAAVSTANRESIVAIAEAAKNSPTPVVIAAYADPVGNRDRNLRLAHKQAASVRDALVTAGVPTLRVVLVSPTFADIDDAGRVEVSAVHGVRAFPARRSGELQ